MNKTKRMTVSAITVALGVSLMLIGSIVPQLDLTLSCLAGVLMAFIYIELGSPYTYLVWLCTALIVAIIFPMGLMWLGYLLVFGIYPVIKGYIERLRRPFWLPIKLLYALITMAALFFIGNFIMGIESESFFGLPMELCYVILALLAVVCFLLYDRLLCAFVRLYYARIRPKIKSFLK